MFGFEKYDYIISNPPYFKLAKSDEHTRSCVRIVDGQTNIYAIFMAICAKMLADEGQMIFITPRSFASGRYFQSFRDFLFSQVHIDFIHLFNTRKDTFSKDEVLQELVIMKMHPAGDITNIIVSFSHGISDLRTPYQKEYPAGDIVDVTSGEKVVYLPQNGRDEAILRLFRSWDGTMEKYGIKISTGPVVAFRAGDYIVNEPASDTVPLYWLHNVVKMLCDHPVRKKDKGQYIRVTPETKAALLLNKNYVLLRRFSSKDDSSRLVAAPYFGNVTKSEFVGIENKLNYIYRPKGHLRRDEVMGLTALLDSELFDAWFRTFNGNINVSATELRMMPLPPIETIREIGRKIILRNDYSIDYINDLVLDYFKIL
ncbi:MAG: Eco57I restriction-modification methylase domain-containing protein [Bacteroidales bacterium]|nr:Eco57I restriction-modification methylase domain-containing protein [Bacteroidales bacterium]